MRGIRSQVDVGEIAFDYTMAKGRYRFCVLAERSGWQLHRSRVANDRLRVRWPSGDTSPAINAAASSCSAGKAGEQVSSVTETVARLRRSEATLGWMPALRAVAPKEFGRLGAIGAARVVAGPPGGAYVRMSFRPNTAHEARNSAPTVTP